MARKRYKPEEIVAKLRQFAKAMKRTAGALRQKGWYRCQTLARSEPTGPSLRAPP
jgi:hypothetical protein